MATLYHGGKDTSAKGYVWATADLDYAAGYGEVVEVALPVDAKILDLSSIECDDEIDMDVDAMADLLAEDGIKLPYVQVAEPQYVAFAIADQARSLGFAGIRICEWTYGVGACVSTMILV